MTKKPTYQEAWEMLHALIDDEDDIISVMSTVAFIVRDRFPHFNWVGFYRLVDQNTLKVGPYQGSLGCLTIDVSRGVCGQCVREESMQLHNEISKAEDHIACDADTEAEIVFPIFDQSGQIRAVFDIDSIKSNCFDDVDVEYLQAIADLVSSKYK